MQWNTELTTLEKFKRSMGLDDENERYREVVRDASRFITQTTRRWFVPYRATRTFDARGDHINAWRLNLDADLLAIETMTNGNGTAFLSTDYVLHRANAYPKRRVLLKDSASQTFTYDDDWEDAISIDGIWGYHENYPLAWVNTNETVPGGGMTASVTTLTLTDIDARDAQYNKRVETFDILRIDDEYLRVMEINTTTNVITLLRGQLGTTAATHDASTIIYKWVVHEDITRACIALATWMERTRKNFGETIQFINGTLVSTNEVPKNIMDALEHYRVTGLYAL